MYVKMEGWFPQTEWQHVQGLIVNGVHPCCPLFVLGVVFRSWPNWIGEEVFFWTRLLHCSRVVSGGEGESCSKRGRHQLDDHYGQVRGDLSLYSPGLGAHFRRHLGGSWACWTLSEFVGGHFPTANGLPVLVIRPFFGPTPPASPPFPSVSGGTGPRWVGLLGCWTCWLVPTVRWDVRELQRLRRSGGHLGAGVPKLSRIASEISYSAFPTDGANCSLRNSQSQWIIGTFTSWLQPTKQIRKRRWCSVTPLMAKLVFFSNT